MAEPLLKRKIDAVNVGKDINNNSVVRNDGSEGGKKLKSSSLGKRAERNAEISKENVNNVDPDADVSDFEEDEDEAIQESQHSLMDGVVSDEEDDSAVFEAGMILEVYMENFMNHRKFSLKLGKLVNFVTGQNGSGKSACVAAIQLCLGATASKTGRASNLAKMVRHGSNGPAICRVTLLNEGCLRACIFFSFDDFHTGDDAYRPDIYGKHIFVERRITRQGLATYDIRGSKSKNVTITRDRRELEKILQVFNIYVDNPCCILTQEQSKTFINGQEKEKYDFFLKATGLERISEEITEAELMIRNGKEAYEACKSMKAKKYSVVESLQKTQNALQDLDKHEAEVQKCFAKMPWCDVQEAIEVVDEMKNKKAHLIKKLESAQATLLKEEKKRENAGSVEDAEAALEEIAKEEESLGKDVLEAVKVLKEKSCLENEAKSVVQQLKKSADDYRDRLQATQNEIAELQAASLKDAAEAERQVVEKISECKANINESENIKLASNDQSQSLRKEIDELKTMVNSKERERDYVRRSIADSERDLIALKKDESGGRANRFHRNMPNVISELKRTSFQSEVVGPLGMEILLRDEHKSLGSAVERNLWRSLTSFVVDNVRDRATLSAILNKYNMHTFSQIYIQSKKPRYEVNLNREVAGTVYVCDCVQVNNDIVFNALVDQNRIDQTVIAQTERESDQKFVTIFNGKRQFLKGINQVLTMDGRSISFKNGNKSSEQGSYPYKKLLAADMSEVIASLQSDKNRDEIKVKEMAETIQEVKNRMTALQSQRREQEDIFKRSDRDLQLLSKDLGKLQEELTDIQMANSAGQTDFVSLEAEANELKEAISEIERRIDVAKGDVDEAITEVKKAEAEKKRLENRRKNLKSRQREQEDIIENYINKMQELSRHVEKCNREVEKCRSLVEEVDKVIAEKQDLVSKKEEKARSETPKYLENWDGSPIELDRRDTRDSLEKRVSKLRGMIEEGKRKAGLEGYTLTIITERLNKASEDYYKFKEEYGEVKRRVKQMSQDLKSREALWEKQVKHYSKMVSRNFDCYMQKRGFSGSVSFNHEQKLLTVKSQTDNANLNTRCTDLRQMSGGERSYTALCLLLALGHVIECPFRLMDEYDVFLDQMARKLTLDILAEYARDKEQRGRQFIIITPQDLRHMKTSNEVRIHKMPDPERIHTGVAQQQTLGFRD